MHYYRIHKPSDQLRVLNILNVATQVQIVYTRGDHQRKSESNEQSVTQKQRRKKMNKNKNKRQRVCMEGGVD